MGNMYMSPLLKNKIQTSTPVPANNSMDMNAVYENLKRHAGDAKPNEAKAKLINDGFVKNSINAIKDTGTDCKNYFKAIKTGGLNDHQLGRINDVGLKIGAGLIATFLALNSKTPKDAAMKFIGGGIFLAMMKLWPKLFINLPAKLVHGFDIDKKYISAQGDKKDFFLDNQFLPWDAYSKEKLEKIGKRTGIDINSPDGEEKIKRKMQKVALQNRTLWMATAGFATPIGTALACDAIEPYIEKAFAKRNYIKTHGTEGLAKYMDSFKKTASDIKNNKAWRKVFVIGGIALAAITLLAQPFFGKIEKEYSENNKNGNNK